MNYKQYNDLQKTLDAVYKEFEQYKPYENSPQKIELNNKMIETLYQMVSQLLYASYSEYDGEYDE